jgi:hypothetical protein
LLSRCGLFLFYSQNLLPLLLHQQLRVRRHSATSFSRQLRHTFKRYICGASLLWSGHTFTVSAPAHPQPPAAVFISCHLRQHSPASCGKPQPPHLSGNIQRRPAVAPQPLQLFSRLFLSQDHCRHIEGLGSFIVL